MGFKSNGVKWIWDDEQSTASYPSWYEPTTTDSEAEEAIKKLKDSKLEVEPVPSVKSPMHYGWVCPKCGRVNAPWVTSCSCSMPFMKIDVKTETDIPTACRSCSNHPSNGGSGICLCTLGASTITC